MRRASGLAVVCRAVVGASAAPSAAGSHAHQHQRIFQAALFSTNINSNNSSARSHWFSYNRIAADPSARVGAHAVAGTMFFSVAATTFVEEVHAKDPVQAKFRPKDVVLYQYEACPFCNKVKGIDCASQLNISCFFIFSNSMLLYY